MYKRLLVVGALLMIATLAMSPALQAQKKKEPPKKTDSTEAPKDKEAPKEPKFTKAGEPKPYDDVIPKTAKSAPGVFTVHHVGDKYYFEIPKEGFNKLMLWQ